MDDRFNTLSQSLFQKSLDECSFEEIQSFIKQYPYFAPAQFLLLKRLDPASGEFKAQYQKALLFHHDPLSADLLIHPRPGEEDFLVGHSELVPQNPGEVSAVEEAPAAVVPAGVETEPAPEEVAATPIEQEAPLISASTTEDTMPAEPETQIEEPRQKEETEITEPVPQGPVSELTFEPFHTVDYFASQGIKLSQEEAPKDQLGKQLKSFTEWLKTMKRLPSADLNKSVDTLAEKKVEHLAEGSVQNSEVVTEAMAEVWSHQGNYQKAIEIYNKLSLLNPSKRAYFASKIDSLKKSF